MAKSDGKTLLKAAIIAAGFMPDLRSREAYKIVNLPTFRVEFGKKSARLEGYSVDAWRGVSNTIYYGQVTEMFAHDWASWALDWARGVRKPEPVLDTEAQKKSLTKSRERSAAEKRRTDGPGFYVTNGTTYGTRLAINHDAPFKNLEDAIEFASAQFRQYASLKLTYLMPVEVRESASRQDAEAGRGYVWWNNTRRTGPPVDPRQLGLFGARRTHAARVRRVHIGDTLETGDLPAGRIAMVQTDDGWAVVHLGPGRHVAKIVLDGASYKAAKHVYLAETEHGG